MPTSKPNRAIALLSVFSVLVCCGTDHGQETFQKASDSEMAEFVAQIHGFTGTDTLDWGNGAQALVRWSGTKLEQGTVSLSVSDSGGNVQYQQVARPGSTPRDDTTNESEPNRSWKLVLTFEDASGVVVVGVEPAQ